MMIRVPRPMLAALLLSAAFAGCIGSDDTESVAEQSLDGAADAAAAVAANATAPQAPYDSFEAAMAASGQVFEPDQDSTVRLKLLTPAKTAGPPAGKVNVTILLFDGAAPVTDANVTLDGIMVAMGHGTSPEEDPVHVGHGIYVGMTNLFMEGLWALGFEAAMPAGDVLTWGINVTIGVDDGTDPNAKPVTRTYEDAFEDSVTDVEYARSWTFPVEVEDADIDVSIALADAKIVDELTFTLVDANGNVLTDVTLNGDTTEGTLDVGSTPAAGEYALQVTGKAVETGYTIELTVTWIEMVPPPSGGAMEHDDHGGDEHHH